MKMKLSVLLCFSVVFGMAQKVIYSQNFDSDTDFIDWQILDRDRDGKSWDLVPGDDLTKSMGWDGADGGMITSYSYEQSDDEEGPLDTDDVLVSPVIQLPADSECTLAFKIGTTFNHHNNMTYQLFVLDETEKWYPTLIPIKEMNFTGIGVAQNIEVNLATFRGKKVKFYWRHYKSFGQLYLLLDDVKVSVNATKQLATIEANKNENLGVYPNPIVGKENLHLKAFIHPKGYKIFNMAGQLVADGSVVDTEVEVQYLATGNYIIVVNDDNGMHSFKFIKK